jgi:hypothetical protein
MVINSREDFTTLFTALNYELGVELGSFHGIFASHILNNWAGKLVCVDLFDRSDNAVLHDTKGFYTHFDKNAVLPTFNRHLENHTGRLLTVQSDTANAAQFFPDNHFDFVYIDADHTYESVIKEMTAWYPKLKSKGLFAGHDFLAEFDHTTKNNEIYQPYNKQEYVGSFGVNTAVMEFTHQHNLKFYTTNEPYWKSWFWFKP